MYRLSSKSIYATQTPLRSILWRGEVVGRPLPLGRTRVTFTSAAAGTDATAPLCRVSVMQRPPHQLTRAQRPCLPVHHFSCAVVFFHVFIYALLFSAKPKTNGETGDGNNFVLTKNITGYIGTNTIRFYVLNKNEKNLLQTSEIKMFQDRRPR